MTDEEFYKNKLIALCNKMLIVDKENIEKYLDYDIEPIIKIDDIGDKELVDIKRKLIIKEKTWYKIRSGEMLYIIGLFPPLIPSNFQVVGSLINGVSQYFTLEGRYAASEKDSAWDIMRECTPEEVKEIEKKLREKNND